MTSKPSHGGSRVGAGRKARATPKSKSIWCGQMSEERRNFVLHWLSPSDRFFVLLAAANNASSRTVGTVYQNNESNREPDTDKKAGSPSRRSR